ncbi:hypothetical protein C6N75_01270 [Streptomyces solincola]|uniref:Uncharacterized protein n=1 Tax=Streptomyces solincola TaxID=2100817 RepID=A0A2S9Q2T5_9ACTN|nr:hypothetical protein [Streptomyces solincola]PRH80981.1 hypothetical protein C6N75_01270 [Streptomyces solincola]
MTLDEAAQRSGQTVQSLDRLSRDPHFPAPESDEGTVFYRWCQVLAFLRGIGEPVPDVPQDMAIAERALRLVDALDGVHVSPGTLRALGLPVD